MNGLLKTAQDQILVIFGSNGDLARRKLLPAIYQLFLDQLLPERFVVLGAGSQEKTDENYRDDVRQALIQFSKINESTDNTELFLQKVFYQKVHNQTTEDFHTLKHRVDTLSASLDIPKNIIYYFSIPPFLYAEVADNLTVAGLNSESEGWKRIIVEKPFGYSYDSAQELDCRLHKGFEEHQIYRIDHYLGKETVQNIMVTRFANGIFTGLKLRRQKRSELVRVEVITILRELCAI